MEHANVDISWTDGEMQVINAAIAEGARPELAPDVAATIRATQAPLAGATWTVRLSFHAAQRLKEWCDARRERAAEQGPSDTWTRIVAKVNEAVQPFAPARGAGSGPPDRGPRAGVLTRP